MYFPEDMNFQYFFFSTYIGYFLQALPIALLAGTLYGVIRYRGKEAALTQKIFGSLFVCYLTGLVCLVIGLDIMGNCWYGLLYQMDPGRSVDWFNGAFDLVPDFFQHINGEVIGNFLMFMPFGILYPLSRENASWKKTLLAGVITVLIIELLQPVVGRAFDVNDIILNTFGIALSAGVFFAAKHLCRRKSQKA